MSGIAKYNSKDWNPHNRIVTYPNDEDFVLEIFTSDKTYEMSWYDGHGAITTNNLKNHAYHAWQTYISANGDNFQVEVDYTAPEKGEYTVELLYGVIGREGANSQITINNIVEDRTLVGGDNRTNRLILRKQWNRGDYHIKFDFSPNVRFYGIVVKKIVSYLADSYLSREAILTMTKASLSWTGKTKPVEFSCEILYDTDYKSDKTLTGFVFDYRDELNFYVRDSDDLLKQVFGGYISACSLNSDETVLTISGASRFIDGDNRALLEAVLVGGEVQLDEEYNEEHIQKYNTYAKAVKGLYSTYEIPLKTNITADFVEGESYEEGIKIDFGTSGVSSHIVANNYEITKTDTSIELRNLGTVNQDQSVYLYDSDWFNSDPVKITDYPVFFLTYGMGEPLQEQKVYQPSESAGSSGGGSVSGDVITVRSKPSCSCSCNSYQWFERSWKNYCPVCHKSGTLTINPKGQPEVEITCGDGKSPWTDGCDSDFCGVCGGNKKNGSTCNSIKLTPASSSADSSSTTEEVDVNQIFQEITNEAFQYSYSTKCSTLECMRSTGSGDCHAFSELIFNRLKEMGVGVKIVQYATNMSDNHQSVLYKNESGGWSDFPYREYGWGTKYNNILNNTSASTTASTVSGFNFEGVPISQADTGSGYSVTTGYDLDNPLLGYFKIEFSLYPEKNAERHYITVDFTAEAPDLESSFKGFTPNLLNNINNTSSMEIIELIRDTVVKRDYDRPNKFEYDIYLRGISLHYHTYEELYNNEGEGDKDFSSCKMILFNCGFRMGTVLSPTNMEAVGKTINELLETLTTSAKYDVRFVPAQHRENDIVELSMNRPLDAVFTVKEGDNGNIIGLSGVECKPISDYKNHSVGLFSRTEKSLTSDGWEELQRYYYVVTRFPDQILRYGEMSVVNDVGDGVSDEEAYYSARKNESFGNHLREGITAVIVGFNSTLKIGDSVDTILQESQYNDRKTLLSLKLDVDVEKSPKIQSTLGLNMIDDRTRLMLQFEEQRKNLRKQKIEMKETALYSDAHTIKLEK